MAQQDRKYEVQRIMDHRCSANRRQERIQYKIHWKGYSERQASWEPADNLMDCQELVINYHKQHPELPPPFSNKYKIQTEDEEYGPKITHKKPGPGEGKIRGRPCKNLIGRLSKKYGKKEPEAKTQLSQSKGDGFNVRMQNPEHSIIDNRGATDLKVMKVYAHPQTNQIFYEVKEFGLTSLKSRKWVLGKNKQALVEFYQSLIVIDSHRQ